MVPTGGSTMGTTSPGRDDLFWFDYYLRGGADRDGDADGHGVVEFDFGELDSEHGGVSGRNAAGGAVADFLPGDGCDGVRAGGTGRRGGMGLFLATLMLGGFGLVFRRERRMTVAFAMVLTHGYDGNWGLRKFAEESDGAGDAAGDLFYFVDDVVEWQCADFAELFDFGGEVGVSRAFSRRRFGGGREFISALFFGRAMRGRRWLGAEAPRLLNERAPCGGRDAMREAIARCENGSGVRRTRTAERAAARRLKPREGSRDRRLAHAFAMTEKDGAPVRAARLTAAATGESGERRGEAVWGP